MEHSDNQWDVDTHGVYFVKILQKCLNLRDQRNGEQIKEGRREGKIVLFLNVQGESNE